jgi:hypothetical protein
MAIQYTWQETGARRFEVRYRPSLSQRLTGFPFMAVGILFVGQLIGNGTEGFAWVFQLIFAVVFFGVGWMVSFRTFTYLVNAGDHYVEHVTSYGIWRKSRQVSTDGVKKVAAVARNLRVGQKRGTRAASYIQVVLQNEGGDNLVAIPFGRDVRTALEVGRKAAEMLAVAFQSELSVPAQSFHRA